MSENGGEKKANEDVTKGNTIDFKNVFIVKTDIIYTDDTDPINIKYIDLNKIKTSKKKPYNKKYNTFRYYIGYCDNNEIIPLIIELPQIVDYCNTHDDGNKAMSLVCNDKLSKKYREILKDICTKIDKKFHGDSTYELNGNMRIRAKIDEDRVFSMMIMHQT